MPVTHFRPILTPGTKDQAHAVTRNKNGYYREARLWHRNGMVFVECSRGGGMLRIASFLGDTWPTSGNGLYVMEMPTDVPDLDLTNSRGVRWTGE